MNCDRPLDDEDRAGMNKMANYDDLYEFRLTGRIEIAEKGENFYKEQCDSADRIRTVLKNNGFKCEDDFVFDDNSVTDTW